MLWTTTPARGNTSQHRQMNMLDGRQESHGITPECAVLYLYRKSVGKAVYLSKFMIDASASNALLHIKHARNVESSPLDEPKLDNRTQKSTEFMETTNVKPSTCTETTISLQNRTVDNVDNTIQLPKGGQDQRDKLTRNME